MVEGHSRPIMEAKSSKKLENKPKLPEKVSASDAFVWNLPGLNMCEFYAAADYLRRQEKSQSLLQLGTKTQTSKNVKTEQAERDTLDYLAILFARVKSSDVKAKHVTATALRKVDFLDLEICIAKNDGPKDKDESFRSDLELWFSEKGPWERNPDLMSSEIEEFWSERIDHYANNIRKIWEDLCKGPKPWFSLSSAMRGFFCPPRAR